MYVYSPDKVGVDAGTLVGRGPTGVLATDDRDAILAMDADVVLHAASKGHATNTNTDDIVALLESGKRRHHHHVVQPSPDVRRGGVGARIDAACARAGTRFHAAGEHPGFMFERLAATLTGVSKTIEKITLQEFVDCSAVPTREMLVDLMGMGKDPREISLDNPMFRAISIQYEQAIGATADVLGVEIERIEPSVDTAVVDHDVELPVGDHPAGTVVGQVADVDRATATVVPTSSPRSTGSSPTTSRSGTSSIDDAPFIRIIVDGMPALRLDLAIDTDPVPGLPHSGSGHLMVAMTAVARGAYVMASPPGVVVAPVFGAFRESGKER